MDPIQLTVIGDGYVGKTSLLFRFVENKMLPWYEPTVFDNYYGSLTVDEIDYNIKLWDTAGQEDYDRLRRLVYGNTHCCILCFAINLRTSFQNISAVWNKEVQENKKNMPIILVGTKCDLRSDEKDDVISHEEGARLKNQIKAHAYIECSALTGDNVRLVFEEAIRAVLKGKKKSCILL